MNRGKLEDSLDGESGLTDHASGTTGGEQTDIALDQTFGQVQQAGLVVDREDSC